MRRWGSQPSRLKQEGQVNDNDNDVFKLSVDTSDDGLLWNPLGEAQPMASISTIESLGREYRHFTVDRVEGLTIYFVEVDKVILD